MILKSIDKAIRAHHREHGPGQVAFFVAIGASLALIAACPGGT